MTTARAIPYIAAALINYAQSVEEQGVIRGDVDTISELATAAVDFDVSELIASAALNILVETGLATIASDDFAGKFYRINGAGLSGLVSMAAEQGRLLSRQMQRDGLFNESDALESGDYTEFYLLKSIPVLQKYSDFGAVWLNKALQNLKTEPDDSEIILPSDADLRQTQARTISLDMHDASVVGAISTLDDLSKEIDRNNEVGDKLGDDKIVIQAELKAASILLAAGRLRVKPFIRLLSSTLRWLIEKAAGTVVAEAAKHLWKLISGLVF
ncbi:hypothetical protein [Sphingomonas alpina]|uniref:Uncharacterized protein n=1 Tax=Sphingomonas alpina TaxID=653931 RepID=A0A7H0LPA8_9SPHN|nr:hypothetical protein [Sphingomonas alpina]QNQ11511.1 hypothetical protein H3Z74_10465 [Sphingomonas alpina]